MTKRLKHKLVIRDGKVIDTNERGQRRIFKEVKK